MSSTIKNAIIFLSIGIVLILVYVFLIRQPAEQGNLVSTGVDSLQPTNTGDTPSLDQDFLPLLLSVKSMTLSDDIFKNKAFENLSDTSIDLAPEGTEGRSNPFASFGVDDAPVIVAPITGIDTNALDNTQLPADNSNITNTPTPSAPSTPANTKTTTPPNKGVPSTPLPNKSDLLKNLSN